MKKTMPKSEAKPLGTPKSKKGAKPSAQPETADHMPTESQVKNAVEEILNNDEKVVDIAPSDDVNFSNRGNHAALNESESIMDPVNIVLNLDTKARKSSAVVYSGEGLRSGVRIAKSAFANKTAPATITISSDAFAQPKAKETKEERKARLAAAPKLTLAEKIAKREESLNALKAKAAKQAAPAVA